MWRRLCILPFLLAGAGSSVSLPASETPALVSIIENGARVRISAPADETTVAVHPLAKGKAGPPLMGRVEKQDGGVVFVPVAPLLPGQTYRARWRLPSGGPNFFDFTSDAPPRLAPKVSLTPVAPLPANALKIYLHFSEPMEQGVFLDRLRLLDRDGKEVIGPFRETELWSPDGKRLTVWFHPGRQKAGVNLNVDEGPVLRPDERYSLIVSGSWRSSTGVAIGSDHSFEWTTTAADHDCPQIAHWKLTPPKAGTQEPLEVHFKEGLDPAMLASALHVRKAGAATALTGSVKVPPSSTHWRFQPDQPWANGDYELHADPALEDLAGNSLEKPFEVDVDTPPPTGALTLLPFSIPSAP